ncbi:hypothetical protein IFT80_21250 [Pseudomonas sp. CFBP 8771]|uniref:hypothetical protein n=1 Tax=Pseudomonas sp. CFBP 8771 TaxID=2775285 RepID=UPI00178505A4|nr:hypothetical protein [Pseudomonas sp. CFBP 8771]MBD8605167.1 hypothetical protein [Pseudomonas sp. CFBP 8771]
MVIRNRGAASVRSAFALVDMVADLLQRLGKRDVVKKPRHIEVEPDIVFGDRDDLTVVELKFYRRWSPPAPGLFRSALEYTRLCKGEIGASKAVLIITCPMRPKYEEVAGRFPEVEIWDEGRLFEMVAPFPDLRAQLEELLEVDAPASVGDELLQIPGFLKKEAVDEDLVSPKPGRELADELLAIERGRDMATAFETACIDALKYLFDHDLHGWHVQSRTVDGLHRRDLVCRILKKAGEVWLLMMEDLGSRYVVFEFKNYSKPITQSEIITTERYLYPSALRKVAIVISHEKCADSAEAVMAGAMREHGKMILPLSVPEIVDLLLSKDEGSDPNSYLFQRVDEFLMGLGR